MINKLITHDYKITHHGSVPPERRSTEKIFCHLKFAKIFRNALIIEQLCLSVYKTSTSSIRTIETSFRLLDCFSLLYSFLLCPTLSLCGHRAGLARAPSMPRVSRSGITQGNGPKSEFNEPFASPLPKKLIFSLIS